MGKTALSGELARRLRFHFTDGIYALTLAPTGDEFRLSAATLRRALADLLHVQSRAFENPDAVQEQEAALTQAVSGKRRMLLIWDNYETVLWRLGREEEASEQPAFDDAQRREAEAVQRLVRAAGRERRAPAVHHPPVAGRAAGRDVLPRRPSARHAAWRPRSTEQRTAHARQRQPGRAERGLPAEIAERLKAARWPCNWPPRDGPGAMTTRPPFSDSCTMSCSNAVGENLPEHQRGVIVNVRLSVNALPVEARRDLLALTVVANPIIIPRHGTVVWGLMEETEEVIRYHDDQSHKRLEQLSDASLLQAQGYDEEHNWALAYSFQPVVAQVLRGMAADEVLAEPRARYARWADLIVMRAYEEGGINYSAEVAQVTQFFLSRFVRRAAAATG